MTSPNQCLRLLRYGSAALLAGWLCGCGADPPIAAEPLPYEETITVRLGMWNIQKLGHGRAKDYETLAEIIDENFDAVVLLEVMQLKGMPIGYYQLLGHLLLRSNQRDAWKGIITERPRPNTRSGNSEYYAVLYRPSQFAPCEGWESMQYVTDNDGGPEGEGDDDFSREPAFACFEAGAERPTLGPDLMLIGYHARYGSGSVAAISAEIAQLERVFAEAAAARPGEQDLVLLGDLNLTPKQLAKATDYPSYTDGKSSTLDRNGHKSGHLYDHLLVHDIDATAELVGNAQVLDVRDYVEDFATFKRTVSDHLPLVAELRVDLPDDDAPPADAP